MALGIGETLRAARRQQRLSLADAAAETRVRETYLAALEEEQFATLGGDVYVKGFLRSYAKYLGIDPDPLVDTYRREHERPDEPPSLAPAAQPAMHAPSVRLPQPVIIGGGIVLVLLLLIFIGSRGGPGTEFDPAPAAASPSALPTPGAQASPRPDDESESEGGDSELGELDEVELVLEIEDLSYLMVSADGKTVYEGEESSDEQSYEASEELAVVIGNAGGVRVEVNGEDQGFLGDDGEVWEIEWETGEEVAFSEREPGA